VPRSRVVVTCAEIDPVTTPFAGVRIGARDEIFQAGQPVLVGVDTASTYCYLLSQEDHRDAETWGVRLLELVDQGFDPDATVADAGAGLRAGQALALPEVPCRGDIFHVLRDLEQLVGFLENRAIEALHCAERCRRQRETVRRAPLTAASLDPVPWDDRLPPDRRASLDRLYTAVGHALTRLFESLGVNVAAYTTTQIAESKTVGKA
jgi:hypothetical protein